MGFARRRPGRPLAAAILVAAVLAARPGAASPIDDPFVGGLSSSGPTSGDLGAVYWNPAALGLMRGFQVMVAGTARSASITVDRSPVDNLVGMSRPGGSATSGFPAAVPVAAGPGQLRGA